MTTMTMITTTMTTQYRMMKKMMLKWILVQEVGLPPWEMSKAISNDFIILLNKIV